MKLRRSMVVGAITAAVIGSLGVAPAVAAWNSGPQPGAQTLRALAQRHGLAVGTAVDMTALADAADPKYKEIAQSEFSTVTAENVMKWDTLEPTQGTYDWAPADKFVEFATKNHQQIRGHVLVWHSQLPTWLKDGVSNGTISKVQLSALLKKHITDVVTHFKGKIWQWDVVNEAVSDGYDSPDGIHYKGFWADNLGSGYIADAFRWARAADPKALLFYNDYNVEAFGDGTNKDKTLFVYTMLKQLLAQGVPVDGLGSQGHLGTQYGNYDALQMSDALKRFTDLGLATAFTEVDVRSQLTDAVKAGTGTEVNPRLQASAYDFGAMMQACLSNQHCISFTVWGFTDKHSWVPVTDLGGGKGTEGLATLYDENYQPKKAYQALRSDLAFSGAPYVLPRIPQHPRH